MKLLMSVFVLLFLASCGITNNEELDKPEFEIVKIEEDCNYTSYFLKLDRYFDTEIEVLHNGIWIKSMSTDRDIVVVYKSEFDMNFRIRYVVYGMKSDWSYYRE